MHGLVGWAIRAFTPVFDGLWALVRHFFTPKSLVRRAHHGWCDLYRFRWWARRTIDLAAWKAMPTPLPTLQVPVLSSKIHCLAACRPLPALEQRAVGLRQRRARVTETIDDRIAAVAARTP